MDRTRQQLEFQIRQALLAEPINWEAAEKAKKELERLDRKQALIDLMRLDEEDGLHE